MKGGADLSQSGSGSHHVTILRISRKERRIANPRETLESATIVIKLGI